MSAQTSPGGQVAAPTRVVGPYRLERLLGRGGMGEVWLGVHVETGGLAAVKLLCPEADVRPLVEAMFSDERRAIARLWHPHVVSWHDFGQDYLAMQYVHGSDLARRMKTPLSPEYAVRVGIQVASALAHAHERGIVHRDVKPANILIDVNGNAQLTDFGIALLVDGAGLASGSTSAGTPSFMAPEQGDGGTAGPLSDQYSLARTLIAILIGRKPELDPDAALAELPAGLPTSLISALRTATSREPAARFPTMNTFQEALCEIAHLDLPWVEPLALRRDPSPFTWVRGACASSRISPDISRHDHLLSALEAKGLLPTRACRAFRERTGYADFGWSVYGRRDTLGPLDEPAAFARATQVVLVAHGLTATREVWHGLASLLCRDAGEAIVLVPDLYGYGASRMREPLETRLATPRALIDAILAFTDILGTTPIPTLLVGHSTGGVAVLSCRDDETPETMHRVAVTPVFPSQNPALRAKLRLLAFTLRTFGGSRRVLLALADKLATGPEMAVYTEAERALIRTIFSEASPGVQASLAEGLCSARVVDSDHLARCTIVVMLNDPVAKEKPLLRALRELGIPRARVRRLVGGMHAPQYEHGQHPEWTARNVNEIAAYLSEVLANVRGGTPAPPISAPRRLHSEDDVTEAYAGGEKE
jgi:hypothetical protein